MADPGPARRLVAVGQKTYLSYAETQAWLTAAVGPARECADRVDLVVFPVAPALPVAVHIGRGVYEVGAQDVSDRPPGPYTGELPAQLLAELGVSYAEVGHAERRFLFGETPKLVNRKIAACLEHEVAPLICVGEGRLGETSAPAPESAAADTAAQLTEALGQLGESQPFVVAYEPVWAIGAEHPAGVEHIRTVAGELRERLRPYGSARLIYGGTAGPGLFAELSGVVDGLFLGRRAHDPAAFAEVLSEVADG